MATKNKRTMENVKVKVKNYEEALYVDDLLESFGITNTILKVEEEYRYDDEY